MIAGASRAVLFHTIRSINGFFRIYGKGRIYLATSVTGVLVFMLLVSSVRASAPSSPVPDASGYEISLGELNKVKKERPVKKEKREYRKRKGESAVQRPTLGAVVPPGAVVRTPAAVPSEPSKVVVPEKPQQTTAPTIITIHHDPYSFVIKGKRTIIQAVISGVDNIQTVYCRFRATEKGSYANVPMLQTQGTLFTYVGTLPSLDAANRTLRYSIVAIDSSGNEVRSQEFAIAVKSSLVLPGWQLDGSTDKVKIRLENKEKVFEGFSDSEIID